jgi:hypothetical protein
MNKVARLAAVMNSTAAANYHRELLSMAPKIGGGALVISARVMSGRRPSTDAACWELNSAA